MEYFNRKVTLGDETWVLYRDYDNDEDRKRWKFRMQKLDSIGILDLNCVFIRLGHEADFAY